MDKSDLNRALERCESFTDYVLVRITGFPAPWTFVTVAGALLGAFALGAWV